MTGKRSGNTVRRKLYGGFTASAVLAWSLGISSVDVTETRADPFQISDAVIAITDTGADPTGTLDSAPAFRRALSLSNHIKVPPGRYRFASVEASPCCAADPAGVLVRNRHDFTIVGVDATIVVDPDISLSSAIQIDNSTKFTLDGLTILGSRHVLSDEQENVALTLTRVKDFKVRNITVGSGFSGNGAGIAGDVLENGVFDGIVMTDVGQCLDVAYLTHVSVVSLRARGNSARGDGRGSKCVSVINDPINGADLNPYVSRRDGSPSTSYNVDVVGASIENFDTGVFISSGSELSVQNSVFYLGQGVPNRPTIGIYVAQVISGKYPSGSNEPRGVRLTGNKFVREGRTEYSFDVVVDRHQ